MSKVLPCQIGLHEVDMETVDCSITSSKQAIRCVENYPREDDPETLIWSSQSLDIWSCKRIGL